MSRSGDCRDNARAASCFATRKAEVADARPWPIHAAARTAICAWLEIWYNCQRRHTALNYHPPATFEEAVLLSALAA